MARTVLRGMRVTLVYPPYGVTLNEPGIRAVKENYGVFPSMSLLYVAGVMERSGVDVQFIDANALGLRQDQVLDLIRAFQPQLVGYSLTTYLLHQTLDWIRAIRDVTGIPTLVGGVHLGLYPHETFTHDCLDYGLVGEAEEGLPELLRAVRAGDPPKGVAGAIYRRADGGAVVQGSAPPAADVDAAPLPARHLVDNRPYHSFISRYRNFTPMMTSRGCPFRCIFCEQGAQRFCPRSPGAVVDEMEQAVTRHGVKEFDLFDSAFTIDRDRVHAICDEIRRRGLDVVWAARSRVDTIDGPLLQAMQGAGCARIYYGLESGNEEILKTLRKSADLEQMRRTIALTREAGIDTFGYFMIGSPGETERTVRQTVRLSLQLGLDYAQYSKVTPMPGTELYRMLVEETGRDWWREIVLDRGRDTYLPRPGCGLDEERIQELTQLAYLRFYYRPGYLARALGRMRSWHEVRRSARTALQMLRSDPEGGRRKGQR